MRLVIDADPIVYRAGFAAETMHYNAVASDTAGQLHHGVFASAKDVTDWCEDNDLVLQDRSRIVTAAPVSHALQNAKRDIHGIIKAVCKKFGKRPRELELYVLLTGPGNFREDVATIATYKGNRDPEHKPVHYQAIRNYLTERWSAQVVGGIEADDKASILCWELLDEGDKDFVLATIDKDLDQVPGQHYDYRQKVFFNISYDDARLAFWLQVLSGDPTDNVPGCYRVGRAKAEKIVTEAIASFDVDNDYSFDWHMYTTVLDVYEESKSRPGCPYAALDTTDVVTEMARLVYMLKRPDEIWSPPDV